MLEMDLFTKSESSAATSFYSSSDKNTGMDVLILSENSETGTITCSLSTEKASMVSYITHESLMGPVLPAQSPPPLQVMGCSGGYDPGRIPSSVFERSKGPTLVEWSITLNESLFSIHIGNVSFSKERFLPLARNLQKSEELGKIKESIEMPPPLEDEGASNSPIAQLELANAIELDEGNRYNIIKENRGDSIVTQMPSLNNNQHDRSSSLPAKNSLCSKPRFPWLRTICCLTSNCLCPSCSCPSCSPACSHWPSCHCKCMCPNRNCSWLDFCFRWPGCCRGCCSCCSCSSCCYWNCCLKGCCSCPSCGCFTLSFSRKPCCYSCFSCQKCRHCC